MKNFILAAASVLALGIGGTAMSHACDANNTPPHAGLHVRGVPAAVNLSKDDIRWAQLELRNMGLYQGSLDGVIGPETKQAIEQYQKKNGLDQTATLDQRTADALFGNSGISQGSSMPPNINRGSGSAADPHPGQSE